MFTHLTPGRTSWLIGFRPYFLIPLGLIEVGGLFILRTLEISYFPYTSRSRLFPPHLLLLMPRVQTAAAGEGGADMHPSLDLPAVSWSEPPRDILDFILEKLKDHRDTLLFGSVCAAWRSFVLENLKRFPRHLPLARCLPQQCQLPLLFLSCNDGAKALDFFCPFEQKFYGGTPLPDSNKWIWGSSKGWLVTADIRDGYEIYLFNPISRDQIYLPSKTEIPQPKCDPRRYDFETFDYLFKAVMSKSPASNIEECAVMGIISSARVLSFCRPSDRNWTNVTDSPRSVDDIIYYKDQFYAVGVSGVVVACNIGPSPKATTVVGTPKLHDDELYWIRYLVESRGELLQVVRMQLIYGTETDDAALMGYRTVGFQVFKLQEKGSEDDEDKQNEEYETIDEKLVPVEDSSYKWVKLDNLHDQIIFLGLNESLSLPAGALPNSRGNCIYFTDDYIGTYHGILIDGDIPNGRDDIGVFNLEDGSIHHFHPKGLVFPMPPIWVSPTPW